MGRQLKKLWRARAFAALPAFAFLAFGALWHEPWRDEAQAVLIAREVPWARLIATTHFEGTPPLFHAFLKVLVSVLPAHGALLVAGFVGSVVLLTGTHALALTITRSPRHALLVTYAMAIGDTYAYELGTLVRQYGFALGLVCFAIAELHRALVTGERRFAIRGAALGGIATAMATHAGCIAGGFVAIFVLLALDARRMGHAIGATLAYLPGFLLAAYCISGAEGRGQSYDLPHANPGNAVEAIEYGSSSVGWWVTASPVTTVGHQLFLPLVFAVVVAGLLYAATRRRLAIFHAGGATIGAFSLLYILVFRFWGSYRHRLFLWNPLIVIVLSWLLVSRPKSTAMRIAHACASVVLVARVVLEAQTLYADASSDRARLFSEATAAASVMPPSAHVVASHGGVAVGFLVTRPDLRMRSSQGRGRSFRYVIPDAEWDEVAPLVSIVRDECMTAPDNVYFVAPIPNALKPECESLVFDMASEPPAGLRNPEVFCVSHIDCACLTRAVY